MPQASPALPVHISRKTCTASQQGPLPHRVSVFLRSRHVMSSPPMWWNLLMREQSRTRPISQRRSNGWSVSSTASSAPSRCSSSRARVRPLWSCVPGSWMHGESPGEACPLGGTTDSGLESKLLSPEAPLSLCSRLSCGSLRKVREREGCKRL